MPFWEQVKRCENCKFWRQDDPADRYGFCTWSPERGPYWWSGDYATLADKLTIFDGGTDCKAYRHDKLKPHPLDGARAYLAGANVGDWIVLRNYRIGAGYNVEGAKVLRYNRDFMWVEVAGKEEKIRLNPVKRTGERAGTLVSNPSFGVDITRNITRMVREEEHPELAVDMLRKAKVGDMIHVVGYPPFDNQRKRLRVLVAARSHLTLKLGRRRVRMHRTGDYAGIIEGEFFVLDTTGETT